MVMRPFTIMAHYLEIASFGLHRFVIVDYNKDSVNSTVLAIGENQDNGILWDIIFFFF